MIEIKKVPASHGFLWIKHGFRLIMRSPLQAVSLAMVFFLSLIVAKLLPGGVLLLMLFMPVLVAGYMRVCRALEYSEMVTPRFVIAGFEKNTGQLVLAGGLLLLGMIVISKVTVMLGGEAFSALINDFQKNQDSRLMMEAMMASDSGLLSAMMTGLVMFLVLTLVLQYTPMLVFFDQMSALEAAKFSMRGSLRNIIPLSIYIMLMQLLAYVLSAIPFNLGLLILLPIGLTSLYVGYRDIFSKTQTEEVAKVGS